MGFDLVLDASRDHSTKARAVDTEYVGTVRLFMFPILLSLYVCAMVRIRISVVHFGAPIGRGSAIDVERDVKSNATGSNYVYRCTAVEYTVKPKTAPRCTS